MRQIAIGLVLCSGCTLYFGDDGMPPGGDPPPPPPSSSKELAIPCIRTIARLPLAAGDHDGLLVTSGCDGEGAVVSNLELTSAGGIGISESFADWSYLFNRTIPMELSGAAPGDFLGLVGAPEFPASQAWAFLRSGGDQVRTGQSMSFERPVVDAAAADLDGDGHADLLLAGDGAIRYVPGTAAGLPSAIPASAETVLATADGVMFAVAGDFGGTPDLDLMYVSQQRLGQGTYSTVSIAMRETAASPGSPPSFGEPAAVASAAFVTPSFGGIDGAPLLVTDLDGDGRPDIVGASPQLFAWLSSTGTTQTFTAQSTALAVGDLDGDGVRELIYQDGDAIMRQDLGGDPTTVFKAWGQLLAVGDLDGDGRDDIALVHGAGLDDSSVVVYLSAAFH